MSTDFMLCNVSDCNSPLINEAWVTRCSHVFCIKHGNEFFQNQTRKFKCPACNEVKNKDSGVIKSNLNPHDMVLACVRPDKAYELAMQACKVWFYQMKIKSKINLNNVSAKYDNMLTSVSEKYQRENYELKKIVKMIDDKLKSLNHDLNLTKRKLKKYKTAYESLSLRSDQARNHLPLTQSTYASGAHDFLLQGDAHRQGFEIAPDLVNNEELFNSQLF